VTARHGFGTTGKVITAAHDPATIVVDASVAIKWLLPEEDQPHALHIRSLYSEGALTVIAAGLIIGDILWKYVTRGLLAGQDAERLFLRRAMQPLFPSVRVLKHYVPAGV
jgi:predicted nucleic acid-binding protein